MASPDRGARRLNTNLRQSVNSARTLSFAVTGITGGMNSAANAAGMLAEGIARASRSARIAASATGIGALVAVAVSVGSAFKGMQDRAKDVAGQVREVRKETEILNAQASGNRRVHGELQIAAAMERELTAARALENRLQKFPALQEAIRAKAEAARRALSADIARSFDAQMYDLRTGTGNIYAGMRGEAEQRRAEAAAEYRREINASIRNEDGLTDDQIREWRDGIERRYVAEMASIEFDLIKPLGDQLGRSFAQSIADGIATGIETGDIGEGFRALTGGILIGLGDMMQQIGTQSLLAANLMQSIIAALTSFAPAGAIGPALLLIAAGGVLKGLGASMGGRRGSYGGGGGYGGSSYGGGGYGQVIDRGLVNPLNPLTGPTPAMPAAPTIFAPIIIGTDDPRAQRDLYTMWQKAQARSQ